MGDGWEPMGDGWEPMGDGKHCTHAACLDVCPTGALLRTEFGTVVVQEDICNGCGYRIPACPYGVIDQRKDGRPRLEASGAAMGGRVRGHPVGQLPRRDVIGAGPEVHRGPAAPAA